MAQPLPKWIMQSYALLWTKLGKEEFDHPKAAKLLKNTSVVLSVLKKKGWLNISLHPEDSRKRLYRLKSPEQAVKEMVVK